MQLENSFSFILRLPFVSFSNEIIIGNREEKRPKKLLQK